MEVTTSWVTAHIFTQNTDILLSILLGDPQLGRHSALIMNIRIVNATLLQIIYDAFIGPMKIAAFIYWYALTGSDTAGHIRWKGKQTSFWLSWHRSLMTCVVAFLQKIGEGDLPSQEVADELWSSW